jgi:hypothetical protein
MEEGFLGIFFLTISLFADILAVGWFGMWLALTIKRPVLAPALTILFVLVLPSCLYRLDLVADMLFVSWGTTQLQRTFDGSYSVPLSRPSLFRLTCHSLCRRTVPRKLKDKNKGQNTGSNLFPFPRLFERSVPGALPRFLARQARRTVATFHLP